MRDPKPYEASADVNWPHRLGAEVVSLRDAQDSVAGRDEYYVYIIWKAYTEPPVPFYVGKGHWGRLSKHLMLSEAKINRLKTMTIEKHRRLGLECGWSIVGLYGIEDDAFAMERMLIQAIGRRDLRRGPLTNRTDGGDGTPAHLAKRGGDSASARPIVANGQSYACLADAALTLGVTSGALVGRIRNGWPGYYYANEGQREATKRILQRYRKEVVVEGQPFASASQAARKFAIDVRMIAQRIALGWEGYFYVAAGQLPRRTVWSNRADRVGVIVRGQSFDTVAEASRVLGESAVMISKRALSSNYPAYERIDGTVEEKHSAPRSPVGIVVGERRFASAGEAARHFDLTDGGVNFRCRSSNFPEWQFAETERQETRAFQAAFSSDKVEVRVQGVMYESQSEAARAHGIDINTLKKRCRSKSFPDWHCSRTKKAEPRDGRPGLVSVEIDGVSFRSISAASAFLNLPRALISERVRSERWPAYRRIGALQAHASACTP